MFVIANLNRIFNFFSRYHGDRGVYFHDPGDVYFYGHGDDGYHAQSLHGDNFFHDVCDFLKKKKKNE